MELELRSDEDHSGGDGFCKKHTIRSGLCPIGCAVKSHMCMPFFTLYTYVGKFDVRRPNNWYHVME